MNRWKVMNCNYWPASGHLARRWKVTTILLPWLVTSTRGYSRLFATHVEAITYADKQARRTA